MRVLEHQTAPYLPALFFLKEWRTASRQLSPRGSAVTDYFLAILDEKVGTPVSKVMTAEDAATAAQLAAPFVAEGLGGLALICLHEWGSNSGSIVSDILKEMPKMGEELSASHRQDFSEEAGGVFLEAWHTFQRALARFLEHPVHGDDVVNPYLRFFAVMIALHAKKVANPDLLAVYARKQARAFSAAVKRGSPMDTSTSTRNAIPDAEDELFTGAAFKSWFRPMIEANETPSR